MSTTKRPTSLLILLLIILFVAMLSMAGVLFMTQTTLMDNYMHSLFGAAASENL